jgi:hypothetical protein
VLARWSTEDLNMVAALLVSAMISTVEAILDARPDDDATQAEIRRTAEKQLRLIVFGMPHWRSSTGSGGDEGSRPGSR